MLKTLIPGEEGDRRVLVSHPERHIARLLEVNLTRQGYAMTCVYSEEEALTALAKEQWPQVIVGHLMPYLDAYRVLERIRTHREGEAAWVVVMLPPSENIDEWWQRPYRADRYLQTPVDPSRLL